MEKTKSVLFTTVIIALFFITNKSFSQVTDIDGNTYKTVTIGKQIWTSENLSVEHYRNGDVIPQIQDKDKWAKLTIGAWCYYENKSGNGKTYGKLYNWYAVNDPRGLAPKGWHIPSDAEWTKLSDFLGGEDVAGGKMKITTLWESPNTGATNESGFTALPAGYRNDDGVFDGIVLGVDYWSTSESSADLGWARSLSSGTSDLSRFDGYKKAGFSCRCVKD